MKQQLNRLAVYAVKRINITFSQAIVDKVPPAVRGKRVFVEPVH
ncbi:hypothetical protein Q4519_15805 [Motilimonas sp. 1_MG-2023]|nr:hypothetical protein [Motilimonas sp. 1_MG-2023]MDO6527146.1 hypothetical protein [Motilimonas sp. 1_MG-2023]